MTAQPREMQTLGDERQVAIDTQQFVAAAGPLAVRIDHQHQGPSGMSLYDGERLSGQPMRQFHADEHLVHRPDHMNRADRRTRGAGEEFLLETDLVSEREQFGQQRSWIHERPRDGATARNSAISNSGSDSGASAPSRRHTSSASEQPPNLASRSPSRWCSASSAPRLKFGVIESMSCKTAARNAAASSSTSIAASPVR